MLTNTNQMTIEQKRNAGHGQFFWPMMAVFYMLFAVRNVLSIEFPVVIYLACVALMTLVFDDTEIKALLLSFIPLAQGFQSRYAILICMIILIMKYFRTLRIPIYAFIVPVLMFWEYLHLGDGFSTIAEYLSQFSPLMCLIIIVSLPYKEEDTAFLSRVLAVSLIVGSLILIANTAKDQSLFSLIQDGFRLGAFEEAEGLEYKIVYNANGLGYICNLAIVGLLTNLYFKKAKKIDYIMLVFITFVGCLTVSRTFLLCLAGTFALYILFQEKSILHKVKVFAAFVLILLAAILILFKVAPGVIENYVGRFGADDITGGRAYLNDFYNAFITSSPERFWYGIGMQSISEKVWYLERAYVNVPHNGYQQMIVGWGVIGLVCMMVFIFCMALHARRNNPKASLMCYLPLILLLTNIISGQFMTAGGKLLSLIYIYLLICNGGQRHDKDIIVS